MERVPGVKVTAHFCKIQDFDHDFYRQFALIICGLDSIDARRWMNAMIYKLYDSADPSTIIPMLDGGTEGQIVIAIIYTVKKSNLKLFNLQVSRDNRV